MKQKFEPKLKEDALLTLLHSLFMNDLKEHKLCASDSTRWYLHSDKMRQELFEEWLRDRGYVLS